VVRRGERRVWDTGEASVASLGAALDGAEMSVVEIELRAGAADFDPGPAPDEEFLLVLSGTIEVRAGSSSHVLATGDALHVAVREPRALRAREAARVLWIALPAATL
jgi:quercetin dioxygenase-like cupin family protein